MEASYSRSEDGRELESANTEKTGLSYHIQSLLAMAIGNVTTEERWALQDHELFVAGRAKRQRYKLISVRRKDWCCEAALLESLRRS